MAVLGSIAASEYGGRLAHLIAGLPAASRQHGAVVARRRLARRQRAPPAAGPALAQGAKLAFLDGIHLACVIGCVPGGGRRRGGAALLPPGVAKGRSAHEPAEAERAEGDLAVDGSSRGPGQLTTGAGRDHRGRAASLPPGGGRAPAPPPCGTAGPLPLRPVARA